MRKVVNKWRFARFLIICILASLLLDASFNLVKSLGRKEIELDYSEDIRNVNLDTIYASVEKAASEYMQPVKLTIDVPVINQLPELINGCEVTSLAMLLNYNGVNVTKKTLAKEVKKDTTPVVKNSSGDIIKWGDPDDGFVGDIEGKKKEGYSIYPKALMPLLNKYLNSRGVDLTGESIDTLMKYLTNKSPILVWVTSDFSVPYDFITWTKNNKEIKATFDEHCVILTGFDKTNFYYNDPLDGGKNKAINKNTFKAVWNSMGNLALSYN